MAESPVMLPAGRARLLTNPNPTGSPMFPITIGIVVVAFCAALVAGAPPATMTSTLRFTNSVARTWKALVAPIGRAPFDDQVLGFDITELAHSLPERAVINVGVEKIHVTRRQETDAPDFALLRERGNRRSERARAKRDKKFAT